MKLATLKDGSRDGTLAVVARDLSKMAPASAVARTLQIALEKWPDTAARLEELFEAVNAGTADGIRDYDPDALESPLPRTYQFVDGSAYLNHVELFRKARGGEINAKVARATANVPGGQRRLSAAHWSHSGGRCR